MCVMLLGASRGDRGYTRRRRAIEIFKRAVNPLLSAALQKTEVAGIPSLTGTQGAFVILVKV